MNAWDGIERMWVEDDPRALGSKKGGIHKSSHEGSRIYVYCM